MRTRGLRLGVAALTATTLALALGGAVAQAADPSIASVSLINADSDQPIAAYTPFPASGATLNLATLPTKNLSFQAFTSPTTTGSVAFDLDGARFRVETAAPYAFNGNTGADFAGWTPSVGTHTLKVTAYTGAGATGTAGTPSTYTFTVANGTTPPPSGQSPWTSAVALPGSIEAENFDKGGEGVAYHDNDAANLGGSYRTTEGVDVEPCADTGGGYNIGHVNAGEWTEYTVNVATAGSYDIGIRFASENSGGTGHVELNGTNVSGTMNLPSTGGWQTYTTVWASGVSLPAATNAILRFKVDTTKSGTEIGNVNQIVVRKAVAATKAPWPASWTKAASAPQPRFESAVSQLNGKIYSFGAFSDWQFHVNRTYVSYDVAANTWTSLGTLPAGMAETHVGIANDGSRYIYFAGGFGGDIQDTNPTQWISNKVWRYDTTNNSWSQIATLPQPRGAGALDLVGRVLHYFGGNPADRVTNVGDHWVYNLDTKVWGTAAPMPNPKDHFSTVVLNGKIYAIGGEHGHDQLHQQQSDVHVYDPGANTWKKLASLPVAKSHIEGGTFVSDGKIVMAGGQVDNFQPTAQAVSYDPAADVWSTLSPSLPVVRQGAIVQRVGQKVVLSLGAVQTAEPQSGTWVGTLP